MDADFLEIGAFAGEGMYKEYGGCPSAGVVAGITYIKNKQCIVVANDSTVKAGAWFPITGKKNLRLQEISIENKLPIIYLVDSAGYSYLYKMKSLQTKNILVEFLEIMLE